MPAGNEVVNALKTSFWLFVSIFVWYKLLNRLELYFVSKLYYNCNFFRLEILLAMKLGTVIDLCRSVD